MENALGLLRVHVERGINLAIRDVSSSDPYVILRLAKQKLKTRVIKKNVNPEWKEDLTLSISDPDLPVKLLVYDKDLLSFDDKMGDAMFEIRPIVEAVKLIRGMGDADLIPSGTIIGKIDPTRNNCLSEESHIVWEDQKIIQHMFLRLRNVESGEIKLRLQWIDIPRHP
ncbi:protein C2-DOMAIN ABA-RELATED 1-like [Impatiens glandulifera]|uniref:protein C2-DOMAIN ABA-RELATED 1-like n=1 Tax=Impatiens glandulifera TaxID=253017 RepID=UPI001FB17089|nr:protein C2-DOMAIN ABA-RELATED 1-like [Impatiens glandulifera]